MMHNEKGWLTTGQAIQLINSGGRPITRQGLVVVGIRHGFSEKKGIHWYYDEAKLKNYIKKRNEKIPDGWVRVYKIVEKTGKSYSKIYKELKNCQKMNINGAAYVRGETAEEIIKNNKK